jgi:hypothetical protein
MEKLLATFSGFHQTLFSFLTAYSPQQLFSQPTTTFFTTTAQPNRPLYLVKVKDQKAFGVPIRASLAISFFYEIFNFFKGK